MDPQPKAQTQMINQPASQPLADPKPPIQQTPPQPKPNILGISLLEVFFVALLLFVIFGALNFFNIVPLSNRIAFLSFLPHLQTQMPTPTPAPQFFYDANTANKTLTEFVHTTLASSYLPSSPSAELYITHKDNIFQAIWFLGNANITATYAYIPNSNVLSYQVISLGPITLPSNDKSSASNSASTLSHLFFQNPPLDWKCIARPSSPDWQCNGNDTNFIYSIQSYTIGTDFQINAQICKVKDKKLLGPHPEIGCLGIFNQQ